MKMLVTNTKTSFTPAHTLASKWKFDCWVKVNWQNCKYVNSNIGRQKNRSHRPEIIFGWPLYLLLQICTGEFLWAYYSNKPHATFLRIPNHTLLCFLCLSLLQIILISTSLALSWIHYVKLNVFHILSGNFLSHSSLTSWHLQ